MEQETKIELSLGWFLVGFLSNRIVWGCF